MASSSSDNVSATGSGDRDRSTVVEVAPEGSKISSSKYKDRLIPGVVNEDHLVAGNLRLCEVQDAMANLYRKATCTAVNHAGEPCNFVYFENGTPTPPLKDLRGQVMIGERPQMFFTPGVMSKWLQLSPAAKDQLLVLMYAPKIIWRKMKLDALKRKWIPRVAEPSPEDEHLELEYYGIPTGNRETVLEYLMKGKTEEQCRELLAATSTQGSPFTLDDAWEMALTSGMANGPARLAAFKLLEMIISLLDGFGDRTLPKIWIHSVTSSRKTEGFPVVSRPSTPVSTRSTSPTSHDDCASVGSSGARPSKKRKLATSDSEDGTLNTTSSSTSMKKASTHVTIHPKFVDLLVVAYNPVDHDAKYIIITEIHSAGKSEDDARRKFMKEIVHVMQGQTEVFGLFFGKTEVTLYKAVRSFPRKNNSPIIGQGDELNGNAGLIEIYFEPYSLRGVIMQENETKRVAYFNVGSFQALVLSIFSCFVHSLFGSNLP